MKITLLAYGTRGDVQPFLALGHGLQQAGYDVTIAAPIDFEDWIINDGFRFEPFATNMHKLIQKQSSKDWLENTGGNPIAQIRGLRKIIDTISESFIRDLQRILSNSDVVISNMMTYSVVDSFAEVYDFTHITAYVQPLTPTRDPASTIMYIRQKPSMTNKIGGYLFMWSVWYAFNTMLKRIRQEHHLKPLKRGDFFRRWNQARIIYALSPLMLPPASDWDENKVVTGYLFYERQDNWQPSQELHDFINAGDAPIYVGFGSMTSNNPRAITELIIEALSHTGQRGIIYKGWADFEAERVPDTIYMLDSAPHDWLFPRMKAIVHHGGSGTTASALLAGRPQTIIAHGADQPYFGRRLSELGVGMPFIHRPNLTLEKLIAAINGMTSNSAMEERAKQISEQIRAENGVATAIRQLQKWLE